MEREYSTDALDVTVPLKFLHAAVADVESDADDLAQAQQALADSADDLRTRAGDAGYDLTCGPAARFWAPLDPVLVALGAAAQRPDRIGRNGAKGFPFPLAVRSEPELTAALDVGGAPVTAADLPSLDLAATPFASALGALVAEAVLLDGGQAPCLAQLLAPRLGRPADELHDAVADTQRTARASVPEVGLTAWTQPWLPLQLDWEVAVTPDPGADPAVRDYAADLLTALDRYTLDPRAGELVVKVPPVADKSRVVSGSALLGVLRPPRSRCAARSTTTSPVALTTRRRPRYARSKSGLKGCRCSRRHSRGSGWSC